MPSFGQSKQRQMRVLVTGASGRIGRLIVRRLLSKGISSFVVRALVRSEKAELNLRQFLGTLSAGLEVVHGDISKLDSLRYAFHGIDAVVIATGPRAQADMASFMAESTLGTLSLGFVTAKPAFWFEYDESPEMIDWAGQHNQIDVARLAGAGHVVMLSSMGGTDPHHFLNQKVGHIANWKRKAEHHLVNSGVPFTILRLGGLYGSILSGYAEPSSVDFDVGVDDRASDGVWEYNPLPSDEIARLCMECLEERAVIGKTFDIWNACDQALRPQNHSQSSSISGLLARLKGKNGRHKEMPFDPHDIQPKPEHSANATAKSHQRFSCVACEDQIRLQCESRADLLDAEAPGVKLVYDDSFEPRGIAEGHHKRLLEEHFA